MNYEDAMMAILENSQTSYKEVMAGLTAEERFNARESVKALHSSILKSMMKERVVESYEALGEACRGNDEEHNLVLHMIESVSEAPRKQVNEVSNNMWKCCDSYTPTICMSAIHNVVMNIVKDLGYPKSEFSRVMYSWVEVIVDDYEEYLESKSK